MIERRQDMHDQFDRLADMLGKNHAETIQRLSVIETFQRTDRADIKALEKQCGEHEKVIQRGKGVMAFLTAVTSLGVWEWFSNHMPRKP